MLRDQFRPEDYGRRGRDELATMRQGSRESVADFVARFRATCLRVPDLAEAEKMDRFTRALVQDVRLQVELRGPQDFSRRGDVRRTGRRGSYAYLWPRCA